MLVWAHLRAAERLAAGVSSLFGAGSAFAATQAAWRFLNNPRVSLASLIEPLRKEGRQRLAQTQAPFGLLVHDWCKLRFDHPRRKRDLATLTHSTDIGYELTTALLVSADDGSPLAPMEIHLGTGRGGLSTRSPSPSPASHLEQVLPTMEAAHQWDLPKPLVHVIDREADSVDHFRRWNAAGEKFLVRGDDRRVVWNGGSYLLSEIHQNLFQRKQLRCVGQGRYQGRLAEIWAVETEVILDRPARKNVADQRYEVPGPPLPVRAIFVEVRSKRGNRLAHWKLLSNVPPEWASSARLALCYYWRWQIESFFKLLKSHGHQLEQWQQATGSALARRLLVAAMACVVVWRLQADSSARAEEFKDFLVRLSGRQTKRGRRHTAPALLAGLWIFLSMLAVLEHYSLHDLKHFAAQLPSFDLTSTPNHDV